MSVSAAGLGANRTRTALCGRSLSVGPAVWRIDLADQLVAADLDLLDAAERARVDRYVNPAHGARFGTARAAGKRLVGRAVGVDPQRVVFGRRPCPRCASAEHGPPVVVGAEGALHISASRRGRLAMLAISEEPVGVDVEPRGHAVDVDGVARVSLTTLELAVAMAAGSDAEREAVLLRCWTRKEAVLKAAGIGIAAGLQGLEVHADQDGPVTVWGPAELPAVIWQVTDLDLDGGATFGAVAQRADRSGPVRLRRWATGQR